MLELSRSSLSESYLGIYNEHNKYLGAVFHLCIELVRISVI